MAGSQGLLAVLVEKQMAALLAADIPAWVDLWADDGVVEFPFSPPGYPKRVIGKRAISEYMSGFPGKIKIAELKLENLIVSADGSEGVCEFTAKATAISTGKPYNQHYVVLQRLRDGKLTLYKDFWNPLIAIEAFGGTEEFTRTLTGRGS